jgi:hypothetical protein
MGFQPIAGENNVLISCPLPDNHFTYVEITLMGQAQICIGDPFTCEHRYTYPDPETAMREFVKWVTEDEMQEEPEGWHRHQPSNRRRPNGDPNHEYIRP